MSLNPMQRKAVMATEGPLLVLAGAGSGKTTVLIRRIENLMRFGRGSDCNLVPRDINEDMIKALKTRTGRCEEYAQVLPVSPWQILAITFTNKAADELKARLEASLGEAALDIWACTFHSACVRMLRRDADRLGFSKSFTIYDTQDSVSLIKQIFKDKNIDDKKLSPKQILSVISKAKTANRTAEEYYREAQSSDDLLMQKVSEIYSEYSRRMKSADSMDFDDLLLYTVRLLQGNEDVRDYWQNRFKYVLIDEYQDTNFLQYLFASLVTGRENNICVVGDDDQSIYKFRGATIENILGFEDNYENCRTIRLEQNYRSTGHILAAANSVISNNYGRKGKNLWTEKGNGELVTVYCCDNERDEGQYVAGQIIAMNRDGDNFRDFAVLYRMNAQSNSIEYALKRNGIPYRIIGGTRFFDRAEVKDVLAYMNVSAAPNDDLRLERIINMPPRGIGAKTVDTARSIAVQTGKSLFEIISAADRYPELARSATRLMQFGEMIRSFAAFAENNGTDAIYDEIVEKTGYLTYLEGKNTPEDTARAENVKELKTSVLTYMEESGDETLDGYLANIALYTDLDNYDSDSDAVTLMTVHSSKGLEFKTVFVTGMEETIFPGMSSLTSQEDLEEERRLCYVAITRAKTKLFLLCARQRLIFGRTNANRVSRFIDEIPEEHVHKYIPRGYGYSEPGFDYYSPRTAGDYYEYTPVKTRTEQRTRERSAYTPPARKAAPAQITLEPGERVTHKAFGPGTVSKLTPMGGDFLVEINFDGAGPKKLMLRAAGQFITK